MAEGDPDNRRGSYRGRGSGRGARSRRREDIEGHRRSENLEGSGGGRSRRSPGGSGGAWSGGSPAGSRGAWGGGSPGGSGGARGGASPGGSAGAWGGASPGGSGGAWGGGSPGGSGGAWGSVSPGGTGGASSGGSLLGSGGASSGGSPLGSGGASSGGSPLGSKGACSGGSPLGSKGACSGGSPLGSKGASSGGSPLGSIGAWSGGNPFTKGTASGGSLGSSGGAWSGGSPGGSGGVWSGGSPGGIGGPKRGGSPGGSGGAWSGGSPGGSGGAWSGGSPGGSGGAWSGDSPGGSGRNVAQERGSGTSKPPQKQGAQYMLEQSPLQSSSSSGNISLRTNYFRIQRLSGVVYHYDVEIKTVNKTDTSRDTKPRGFSTRVKRRVVEALQQSKAFKKYVLAFDGTKNLYTSKPLPSKEVEHCVAIDEKSNQDFFITLKLAYTLDMEELKSPFDPDVHQKHIQALDILIRHAASQTHEAVGRYFFKLPHNPPDKLAEVYHGFYTTFRPCKSEPMLNIDFAAMSFCHSMTLLKFAEKVKKERGASSLPELLSKELKGLQIYTTYLGYKRFYRVERVSEKSAKDQDITVEEKKMNVAQYFKNKGLKIKSHLRCIKCEGQDQYLPQDLCHIPAQPYRHEAFKEVIQEAFRDSNPMERFTFIQDTADELFKTSRDTLNEFRIELIGEMVKLNGRIISPPSVKFMRGQLMPDEGSWKMLFSHRFFSSRNGPTRFSVLAVDCKINENIGIELTDIGEGLGIKLEYSEFKDITTTDDPLKCLCNGFKDLQAAELVLVVLGNPNLYATVKAAADVSVGVLTQCLQVQRLSDNNYPLWRSICLKINAKLGGCNNVLCKTDSEETITHAMVIGIDVNHPAPGDTHTPSLSACVASMDQHAFQYRARVGVQMDNDNQPVGRKEVVMDLKAMVLNHLQSYQENRKALPEKIIVYRDGVGEGQFKDLKAKEVNDIRSACQAMGRKFNPPLTYIVVQKRHHTRFQPLRGDKPQKFNVPPGTTVQETITHPEHDNFFLCSQKGVLGTSRPAHYHILCNDSKYDLYKLQKLTYDLCHLVARCTRSVSTPAPVYYAHLAAFRAKKHIEGRGLRGQLTKTHYTEAVTLQPSIAETMYFV